MNNGATYCTIKPCGENDGCAGCDINGRAVTVDGATRCSWRPTVFQNEPYNQCFMGSAGNWGVTHCEVSCGGSLCGGGGGVGSTGDCSQGDGCVGCNRNGGVGSTGDC